MKGSFLQKNLVDGLAKVSHLATTEKRSLPILGNILLRAEKGLLYLISTNLEVAIETYIGGKIEEPGSFTVPATLFFSHLNFLPDNSLSLEVQNNELCLEYKNGQTKIKGLPAEDFPIIPRLEKKNGLKLSGQELKKSLQRVIIACSASEVRPEISGILFQQQDKELTLVGTDSYRLAERKLSLKEKAGEAGEVKKILVPLKTCQELLRILNEDNLEIFFSENQILFSQGPTSIISRIVQAEFPNYQEIIPKNFVTKAITGRDELIKSIRGASPFSKTGVNDISLDFSPASGTITVSSLNPQAGETKLEIKAEIFGKKNSLSLNYRYILEGLASISSSEVSIEIIDESSPVVLKPSPEENFLYLLMPIKT